jgi:hypothetical protein
MVQLPQLKGYLYYRVASRRERQGCQIYLGPNIPKREKYTK